MTIRKEYVEVITRYDIDGNITPLCIIWEDGAKYPIDRILDRRRAASLKAGGMGMRYTIRIQGKETYMWLYTQGSNSSSLRMTGIRW